jgi:16S rRNA (cytosine967-C5)-methyltransferase
MKSLLAQILPLILLRPVSLAEDLGIGVDPGEPWSLSPERLRNWPAATAMAAELHARMQAGAIPTPRALEEDFPETITSELKKDWGAEATLKILSGLVQTAPLTLRFTRSQSRASVIQGWKKEGKIPVKVTETAHSPLGIQLAEYSPVFHLPEYEKGWFEIQDEGSQLMSLFALDAASALSLLQETPASAPGKGPAAMPEASWGSMRVVDACAGAGGKSLAMADLMKGQGRVFSYDISERKVQALRRRAKHAGLNNIQGVALKEGEEAEALAKFAATADRVLVDAPCSGWGVLRRNPDIKWRQEGDALTRFPAIQLRLLEVYSTLVKKGGQLTFGTCTFRKSETLDVVAAFSKKMQGTFKPIGGGYFGPSSSDGFYMHAWVRE